MDGSASIGLEQALLGHSLGFAPFAAPTQVYVSLCLASTVPSETVPGLEASGGGYARMPATFALIAGPSNIAANTTSIEFPQALSSWGQIGFFELWDAPNGGNRLYCGQLVDTGDFTTPLVLQVSAGDITRFSAGTLGVQASTGAGGTASIGVYLPLAGGQMAGPLLLSQDPLALNEAATKSYVDAHSGTAGGPGFLPLSGGTMLGALTLSGPPAAPLHAATRGYVDTLPVTATGSTTPRSLPDWMGDVDNALAFGATGDGTGTGDVAAITAIITRQTRDIGQGFLPYGRYANFSAVTPSPRAMMWWLGSGVEFVGGHPPPGTAFPVAYNGSTTKPWFEGPVGFGQTVDSVAKAATSGVNIQRTNTYSGSGGALSAAFNITETINPGVASTEQAGMTVQVTDNGSNVQVAQCMQAVVLKAAVSPSAVQIRGWALTAKDNTGRMTSIAGPVITEEVHIFGSGPDDTASRVMSDRIFNRVGTVSTDGPAGVARGMRMRGEGIFTGVSFEPVNVGAGISVETTQYALGASGPMLRGFVAFDRAFQNDGANVAFDSFTATATARTLGATASAATSLVLSPQSGAVGIGAATGWFQPGQIISGHASIPAGTTVVSSTVDATWNTTVVMSAATTGTIPINTPINFSNVTGTSFRVAGNVGVGLDTSAATLTGAAVRLAAGQAVVFDAAGTRTLSYDSASGKMFVAVSGVNRLSIDASGNVRAAGTITGSVTP